MRDPVPSLARALPAALLVALVAALPSRGDAPEAKELVEAVRRNRPAGERRTLAIETTTRSGAVRKRTLAVASWWSGAEDRTLLRFLEPRDVARLGLLTVQKQGEDDQQHLFLPSLKKAKRITASERGGLFAGTDFAYEDLRHEDTTRHEYRVVGEEAVDGAACRRIEALPSGSEKDESIDARRELLIEKERPVLRLARLYARDGGELAKTVRFSDHRDVGGFPRPHRVEVDHVAAGSKTVALASDWTVDAKLDADQFTVFELEKGR